MQAAVKAAQMAQAVWTDTPSDTSTQTSTLIHKAVALVTYHGRYVTAMNEERDWGLGAETRDLSDWEMFTLLCLDDGKAALKTYHSRYVTGNWKLRAETKALHDWEKFTFGDAETGQKLPCSEVLEQLEQGNVIVTLKTYHDWYVTAMDDQPSWDWELTAGTDELRAWEKFTLVPLPIDPAQ